MKAFFGTFVNKLDGKGRVSVPAPFRAVIQGRGLTSVAVHPSLFEACLEGAGFDRFENLEQQIAEKKQQLKEIESRLPSESEMERLITDAGYTPARRNTRYERV